jgi:penicillin-binding protein 1A
MFKTLLIGKKNAGGGSTITQQLAKNLFPRDTAEIDRLLP